jgi:hypothetical protein
MPDESPRPLSPPPNPAAPPAPKPVPTGPTINIGDEFGTAKRNLPPARILLIAIAGLLIVVGAAAFFKRAKPQGFGSLANVQAAEIPGQGSTMVAMTFALTNTGEKILYVRSIEGKLTSASGEATANALSAVDFERYFTAFPPLRTGAQPALTPETKLQPGEQVLRTALVVFPVTLDVFNQRKSLSVVIQPYDQQVPVVLTK